MIGAVMAIEEINNKEAGQVELLLPDTTILFEWAGSRGTQAGAMLKSIELVEHSFDKIGLDALIGAGSSSRSETAHTVLNVFDIPMVSYAATSPVLSDADLFPNFFRTVASDTFQATAVVEFLDSLGYKGACTFGTDLSLYSVKGASAFNDAAKEKGMTVLGNFKTSDIATTDEAEAVVKEMAESECRVVFAITSEQPFGMFARSAVKAGIMGQDTGWVYVVSDAVVSSFDDFSNLATQDGATSDGTIIPAIGDLDATLKVIRRTTDTTSNQ